MGSNSVFEKICGCCAPTIPTLTRDLKWHAFFPFIVIFAATVFATDFTEKSRQKLALFRDLGHWSHFLDHTSFKSRSKKSFKKLSLCKSKDIWERIYSL
jgi:hypothetical protein